MIWWLGATQALRLLRIEGSSYLVMKTLAAVILCAVVLLVGEIFTNGVSGFKSLGRHPILEMRHLISSALIFISVVILARLNWPFYKFWLWPFRYIAPFSYGLYVLHKPLLDTIPTLADQIGLGPAYAAVLVSIFLTSIAVEQYIHLSNLTERTAQGTHAQLDSSKHTTTEPTDPNKSAHTQTTQQTKTTTQ